MIKFTNRKATAFAALAFLFVWLWQSTIAQGASASVLPLHPMDQVAPPVTPQPPQPDGSIIHEVRPGDTLAGIALAYKVDIEELRKLNNIPPEVGNIYYGQKLIVKLAPVKTIPPNATIIIVTATFTPSGNQQVLIIPNGQSTAEATAQSTESAATSAVTQQASADANLPATAQATEALATEAATGAATEASTAASTVEATATPTQTETPAPPTATLIPISNPTEICVSVYNDANTNHWRDIDETLLAGSDISLTQGQNAAQNKKSVSDAPSCFQNLQAGIYTVNVNVPSGYGLTTAGQLEVDVKAGTKNDLVVGAAQGYQPPAVDAQAVAAVPSATPTAPRRSLTETIFSNSGLIVLGLAAVILIGGLGVAALARRFA